MERLKDYLDKSMPFNYLKDYYNSIDIADVFGVSDMEIKHSNFLKWVLQPVKESTLGYFPIRQLLKLIQTSIDSMYDEYNSFKQLDLDKVTIKNVEVVRERHNIDFVIYLTIDDKKFVIAMENKIEAPERKNQLLDYKKIINKNYPDVNKLFVLLHPSYQQLEQIDKRELLKESAKENRYISITYQNIYDVILKEWLKIQNDSGIRYIIHNYIHTLSCYSSNRLFGLIVNDAEKENLEKLFSDEEFINILEDINNNTETYEENKEVLIRICNKYKLLKEYKVSENIYKVINKLGRLIIYKFADDDYQPNSKYEFAYIILKHIVKNESIMSEDDFGEELKNCVFGKSKFLYSMDKKLDDDSYWITDYNKYPPIVIDGCSYYSTNIVGDIALIELCDFIVDRFPEYKGKIVLI